jgi:hypothetical protein
MVGCGGSNAEIDSKRTGRLNPPYELSDEVEVERGNQC